MVFLGRPGANGAPQAAAEHFAFGMLDAGHSIASDHGSVPLARSLRRWHSDAVRMLLAHDSGSRCG
jgi:hypothetical protein